MKCRPISTNFIALTLVEVLVVILAMVVVLGLLLPGLPSTRRRRPTASGYCIMNLRILGTAFRLWGDDNGDHYPMHLVGNPNCPQLKPTTSWKGQLMDYADASLYFQAISNELNTPKLVACPSDDRQPATNFASLVNSNVSYFVGLDANEEMPKMLLAGDHNVVIKGITVSSGFLGITNTNAVGWSKKIHNLSVNVTMADGSAQKLSVEQLEQAIGETGTNVNRLVFP